MGKTENPRRMAPAGVFEKRKIDSKSGPRKAGRRYKNDDDVDEDYYEVVTHEA